MKIIYHLSTYIGILLLLLSVPILALHLLGNLVGLTFITLMPFIIPIIYIAIGFLVAPVVHRKIYKTTD